MSPWKVILATMVIFGCGVVTGGLLMKTVIPPPLVADATPAPPISTNLPPPLTQLQRPELLRRMQKQLDLTASQRDEIAKIMKESQERSRPLWKMIAPQLREEVKRVREEINKVLTPDQQKKFNELLKARPRKSDGAAPGKTQRAPTNSPAQTNTP